MQVDPGPPTRQSRTSINYLLSPEQPSTVKFRNQSQSQRSQESKPVKVASQSIRCTSCEELISTTDGDGNQTGLWEIHAKKCTKASPTPSDASSASVIEDTTPFRRHKAQVNEEERLAFFRKDKQIGDIKEYQVLCAFCDTWIQLRKDRPYCSIAWTEHKLTCRRRQPSKKPSPKPLSTSKRPTREHTASSVVPAPPPDNTFTPSSSVVVPNLGPPGLVVNVSRGSIPPPTLPLASFVNPTMIPQLHHPRRSDPGPGGLESSPYIITSPPQIRRTEAERVKLLVSDPNATTVEPHRVLCGVCGRWIQLRKNSTYCTAPWIQHVSKCVKRNGQNSARNGNNSSVQRNSTSNSTSMVQIPPGQATPSISRASAEQQQTAEREELESDADPEVEDMPQSSSSRRPRGRPRKRRNQNGHTSILGRRSISPIPPPSPPPSHPYPGHRYVYTSVPPVSKLLAHYAHSQYSTTDDSYAMYFDVEAMPPSLLSQMTTLPPFPPGDGKRWIVYQLQNYEKNGCLVQSVLLTTTSGTREVKEDGDENMEEMKKESATIQPADNGTAGDRVNDAAEPSSLKTRNWSHSTTASIEESNSIPYQQKQEVVRSTSPGKGSLHGEQENNGVTTQIRSQTPHRPPIPAYESPRLPREPYRSPHLDVVSPEPTPQPNLPPSPPPSASIQPTPIPTPRSPPVPSRRPRYLWESDDDDDDATLLFRKPVKPTKISNSPPPPAAVPASSQPPLPLPQHHRPILQTNYSASSTTTGSTSPAIPYRAQPQPQPPIRLPPIPVLPPSGPYAIPDPYHSPPVPQQRAGERDYHSSPRHTVPIVDKPIYRSPPPPPPPPMRDNSPPPRRRYYDVPGSSSNHAPRHSITAGMKYRSPAQEDRRSSFPNTSKKRSRQSRSRSPKSSIPPPRPVPTSMARVSPEARLFYTHRCIAYLFQTTLKGAVDIPLMTLMTFMNDGFEPQDSRTNYFTFEEVRDCVAELGRRQMLIFTQEGGVQFGETAMDFD